MAAHMALPAHLCLAASVQHSHASCSACWTWGQPCVLATLAAVRLDSPQCALHWLTALAQEMTGQCDMQLRAYLWPARILTGSRLKCGLDCCYVAKCSCSCKSQGRSPCHLSRLCAGLAASKFRVLLHLKKLQERGRWLAASSRGHWYKPPRYASWYKDPAPHHAKEWTKRSCWPAAWRCNLNAVVEA